MDIIKNQAKITTLLQFRLLSKLESADVDCLDATDIYYLSASLIYNFQLLETLQSAAASAEVDTTEVRSHF